MMPTKNPWDQRCWRGGICRSDLGGKTIKFWVMALLFVGVVAGVAYKSPNMLHFSQGHWEILVPGGVATVGLFFLVAALIATMRWLRFGGCVVRLKTLPGVIGGHFHGEVLLPESFPPDTDARMELVCTTTTTTPDKNGKSGDRNDRTEIKRNWAQTIRITATAAYCHDGHCVLPFDYQIPYGLPDETSSRQEGNARVEICWNLRVFARLQGPDLDITYCVPVFQTPESDSSVTGDASAEKMPLDSFLRDTGEQRRVRVEYVQGVTTYVCAARIVGLGSVVVGFFGLVFLSFAVAVPRMVLPGLIKEMLVKVEGWNNLFRLIPLLGALGACLLAVVFGFIGLLFLCMGLQGCLSRRTWIQGGMIHQHARFIGIPWFRRKLCAGGANVYHNESSSNGKTSYDVVIERDIRLQRRYSPLFMFNYITVATDVPTVREADEIVRQLRADLK